MSSDDQIAVVYNKDDGKWYVLHVQGGRIDRARSEGAPFITKKEAKKYAYNIDRRWHTEYGVCIYN